MRGKLTNVADRTERNLSYQMLVIAGHAEGFTVNGSRRGAIGRDISEGDFGGVYCMRRGCAGEPVNRVLTSYGFRKVSKEDR